MRVVFALDVGEVDRYVIAKHYERTRRFKAHARATRAEVRGFLRGALAAAIKDCTAELTRRQRVAAARIATPRDEAAVEPDVPMASQRQLNLFF